MEEKKSFLKQKIDLESPNKNIVPITTSIREDGKLSVGDCSIEELVKKFPKNIIGVKDSSYNLFEKLKIDNFSVLPGSESKLFKGLQLGCSGIITATCNATSALARKVYDDFNDGNEQTVNQNLCDVRAEFEKYNLKCLVPNSFVV